MKKIKLLLIFFISYNVIFAQKNKIILQDEKPMEQRIKQGWQLIFEDNFDSQQLDFKKWNKSNINDDYGIDKKRSIVPNPDNVFTQNGNLILKIDTTNHEGASFSGAEVKTYSTLDSTFNSYSFIENSMLEIKVKTFFNKGLAGAVWLYSDDQSMPYSEIDLFETHATKRRRNEFNVTYHWNNEAKTKRAMQGTSVQLFDSKNKKKNIDEDWLIYKCVWTKDSILWWINDQPCYQIAIKNLPLNTKQQAKFYPPINSMKLRITALGSAVGKIEKIDKDFTNTSMLVDYVRLYKKEGYKLLKEFWSFNTISKNETKIILMQYLAGVKYEWIANDFEIINSDVEWHKNEACKKFKPNKKCISGKNYPVKLIITLQDGTKQEFDWQVKVN
jgi:hypothetical protein